MADYQDRALLDISDVLKKADIVEERLARAFAVKTGQAIQTPTLKVDGAATRQLSELDTQVNALGKSVRATRAIWQTQALTDDETVDSSRRLRDELLKLATAEDANIDTVLRAANAAAQAQRTMDQARGQVTKGGLAYNASLGIIDALGNLGGPAGAAAGLVGQYVVQGLTRSLHRGQGAVGAEADGLSDEIVRTLKAKLKIQSPSVVMEEIGRYIMEGLLSGFKSSRESVLGAVREVGSQIPNTFRAAAEGGQGVDGGSLVTPLVGGLESELLVIPELFQKVFGDLAPVAGEALGEVSDSAEEASLNIAPAFDGLAAGFEKASGKLAEFPAAAAPAAAAASEAAEAAGEAGAQAEEAGNGFEQLSGFLGIAAAGVTAFGAALAVAVPKAAEFQGHLAAIATESDLTTEQLNELGAGLLDMSGRVGQSAQTLARASYDVVGAGVQGADTIAKLNGLTEISARAASAGLTEVGVSANVITSALNAYGLSVDNAQHVSDVFFKTTATGKISFEQLANNMGEVLPKASTLGVSLEELGASAAALTSSGVPAAQAVTGINAALDNILKPTEEAKVLSKELGLEFSAAALQGQGWEQFLSNVQEATGGNTELLGRLFGSTEAVNAIFALTSSDGAPRFRDALDEIRNSAGATDEAFKKQSDTFEFAQKQFTETANAFQIEFGLKFLPILTKATQGATELITEIDELGKNGVVQFALIVGGAGLAATAIFKVSAALRAAAVSSALFQAASAAGGFKALIAAAPAATNGLTKLAAFIPRTFLPQTAALTKLNGALVNVVGRLGVFGQAGLVAGAAFAGWKIGEWVGKLTLFGDKTTSINDKLTDFFATTFYGADPQLIREAREAEEAQQQKALSTQDATDATIDSGAAERQLAEDTKRANAARADELETIRQQKLALVDLNKELGERRVKLELEGKSEFLNDLDSLGQAFDDLREKFKAPFYVNGQLDRSNPRLQEGLNSLDAQREAEMTALLDKELGRQDDLRLKHERDVQSAKAGLLKDETERRRIELGQQVADVEASYQKQILAARQNSQAPGLDAGQRQRFLDQATALEGQQAAQVTAIRAKSAQDIAEIEAGRLRQTQTLLRSELDAQVKVNGAATALLQQQRDRALDQAGQVAEDRLAIEERFGPQLLRLQAQQAVLSGQAARAQLLQTLGQQLKDAETAGSQRAAQEKSARATYLSELGALELSETTQAGSRVLAQEKRVQAERLAIYQQSLDERLSRLKDATGKEIAALERTLATERARAQASGDGGRITAIDGALKQIGQIKTENLSSFKTVLTETRDQANSLGSELKAIGQTPLTAAIKSAVAPVDSVLKGAQKQLTDLRKSFGKTDQNPASTALFEANEARLTAIIGTATAERLRLKTEAEAKFERERQDKAQTSTLALAKREAELGRLTLDGYGRLLAADQMYWGRRRDNALAGSQDREQAEAKLRENEDERLRLASDLQAYQKDAAAFSREQLQTAVELATNERDRAAALERLNISDQTRLTDLDREIGKLQAQGGHEREILALKRERAGVQKDLAARQEEETEHARALTQSVLDRIDAENKLAERQARTDAALAATRQTALGSLQGRVGSLDGQIIDARSEAERNKLLADRAGLLGQILDLQKAIALAPVDAEREQQDLLTARIALRNKLLGLADDEVTVAQEGVRQAEEDLRLAREKQAIAQNTGTPSDQRQAGTEVTQAEIKLLDARNTLTQAPLVAEKRRLDLLGAQKSAMLAMAGLGGDELAQAQLKLDIAGRELVLANERLAKAQGQVEVEAALKGQAEARVNYSQTEGAVQAALLSQAKAAEQRMEAVRNAQREYARAQLKAARDLLDVSLRQAEVESLIRDTAGDSLLTAERELSANRARLAEVQRSLTLSSLAPDDRAGALREQIDLLGQISEGERRVARARVDAETRLLDVMDARRTAALQILGAADDGVATAQLDLDLARERLALVTGQANAPGLGRSDQNDLLKQQIELSARVAQGERKLEEAQRARLTLVEELTLSEGELRRELAGGSVQARAATEAADALAAARVRVAQAEREYAAAQGGGNLSRIKTATEGLTTAIAGQRSALAKLGDGYRTLLGDMAQVQSASEQLRTAVFGEKGAPFNSNREIDRFMALQKRRDSSVAALQKALTSGDKAAIAAATQELATQEKRYRDQAQLLNKNGVRVALSNEKVVENLSNRVDDLGIQYDREAVLAQQKLDAAGVEAQAALTFTSAVQVFGEHTAELLAGVQEASDRLSQPTEAKDSPLTVDLEQASRQLRVAITDGLGEAGQAFARALRDAAPPPLPPARTLQQQRQLEADLASRYASAPLPAPSQPVPTVPKEGGSVINNIRTTTTINNSVTVHGAPGQSPEVVADIAIRKLEDRARRSGKNC